MSPRLEREYLADGSFIELAIEAIQSDAWRPHGYRYRLAWVQEGRCRILFDNHHGKMDHRHIDDKEEPYEFVDIDQLVMTFLDEIRRLGGAV